MYEELMLKCLLGDVNSIIIFNVIAVLRICLFVLIGYLIANRKFKKERLAREEIENNMRELAIENVRLQNIIDTYEKQSADAE